MFIHNIEPVLIELGPFEIRYYGLVYFFGFLFLTWFLTQVAKKNKIRNLDKKGVNDYIFYLILGSIIFARLFYVIVYNPAYYLQNPLEIIMLQKGGLSIHGGLIGAFAMTYWFCRKNKIKFNRMIDYVVLPLPGFLFLGRLANFANAELYGTVTDVPWCVQFPTAEGCRHPSQLYEAAKNVILQLALVGLYMQKRFRYKDGTIFWSFVGLYGLLRFFATFYRVAEYYWLGIGIGQWISLAMVPVAAFMIYRINR